METKSGLSSALIETMKAMRRHIELLAAGQGLAPAQLAALKKLRSDDGLTTTELGSRLSINNSTVTALVDRLERDGLVSRDRCGEDRRVVRVWLTDHAKKLAAELPDLDKYVTALALREFSPAELGLLVEWLDRLQRLLQETGDGIK